MLRYLLVALAASLMLAAVSCAADEAPKAEPTPQTIVLTDEQVQKCDREGGCFIISAAKLQEVVDYLVAKKAATALCPGSKRT